MTIALNTPIQIPNLNRIKITRVNFDEDMQSATLHARGVCVGGVEVGPWSIIVRNGDCQGITRSQVAAHVNSVVTSNAVSVASGYDNLFAAWKGGNTHNARMEACETQGLADGWIDVSLAGVVS